MSSKRFFRLLILSLIALSNCCFSQSYWFRHYNVQNGLSYNHINCSLQDKKGFLWFGTLNGLNRFDGYNLKVFQTDPSRPSSIGNNFISTLYRDNTGTIWVGTHNGLWQYNETDESFSRLNFTFNKWIAEITEDRAGSLWFVCNDQLFKYNLKTKLHQIVIDSNCNSVICSSIGDIWTNIGLGYILKYSSDGTVSRYNIFGKQAVLGLSVITRLFDSGEQSLFIATKNQGLKLFDIKTAKCKDILTYAADNSIINVTDVIRSGAGEYWVSTTKGIYILNIKTGKFFVLNRDEKNPNSLSDDFVTDLTIDNEGGIWAGTKYEGLNYFNKNNALFSRHLLSNVKESRVVFDQIASDGNNLWLTTENNGLYFFDVQNNKLQRRYPAYDNLSGIMIDGNDLWLGKTSEGLDIINIKTGKIIKTYPEIYKNKDTLTLTATCFIKTANGVFTGTTDGVYFLDYKTQRFKIIKGMPHIVISSMFKDGNGGIWVGSYFSGVYYIDPGKMTSKNMRFDFSGLGKFNNTVTSITDDDYQNIWFSTESEGIAKYDYKTRKLSFITVADGLPSNNTCKLLKGNDNELWLSTADGICKFDPVSHAIQVFKTSNGLPCDQFTDNSGYNARNGKKIYFGSTRGLISFDPGTLKFENPYPSLYITGLQVDNIEPTKAAKGLSLSKSIIDTKIIELPYNKSSISIDFAALSYVSPELTQYSYVMKGLESGWTYLKTNRKAYFTKLPVGRYVFEVKASTSNGIWGASKQLVIYITPPWWLSNWAYIVYICLAGLAVFLLVYYYHKRSIEKNKQLINMLEHEKDKEIYKAKIDFFTNIAHEIRTPLTLIVAPIEKIEAANSMTEVKSNAALVHKNADRLVKLTNQLLDFRKIEQKNLKLNFVKTNIHSFLKDIFDEFRLSAESKKLSYRLVEGTEQIYSFVDPEALTKIISNLLQNAIKFARHRVLVTLNKGDDNAIIIILSNDGPLIPNNLKEKIFEPFYRLKSSESTEGTGIGLALAQSLTELHNGTLTIGKDTNSNEFILTIPVHQEIEFDFSHAAEGNQDINDDLTNETDQRLAVLVVEDSADILSFMYNELLEEYQVYTAANGRIALEILNTADINLVISDVMMPEMDGFELCRYIKKNISLSHIPVILLTAKNNITDKITGLELDADVYIEKPFSPAHVNAQVASLLRNREKVISNFNSSPMANIHSIAVTKTDDVFLTKLNEFILKNLDNPDLAADQLASMMYMSRRNLYRKIKATSGLSPADMINVLRLKHGAEMLLTTDLKIYQIANQTGFNSPDTFSRNFMKQFGVLPTEYAKQVKKNFRLAAHAD